MAEQALVLVGSGLNTEQVLLMRPIYIEKIHFCTKRSGFDSEAGLNIQWSL